MNAEIAGYADRFFYIRVLCVVRLVRVPFSG